MRFSRDRRLADKVVFNALLLSGRRIQAGPVGARLATTTSVTGRLGITVAKRHLKRAVDRNHVKRLIREAYRRSAEMLGATDVLISLRYEPKELRSRAGRSNLSAALDQIFEVALRTPRASDTEHG